MSNLLFLNIGSSEILIILFCAIAYFGLIIFCMLDAVRATFKDSSTKIIWVLVILFFPFLGSILYLTLGRRARI